MKTFFWKRIKKSEFYYDEKKIQMIKKKLSILANETFG